MKKHYKFIVASATLFLATSLKVTAQLSGIVTIDSSQPTLGNVYQSFSALAAALNTAGSKRSANSKRNAK